MDSYIEESEVRKMCSINVEIITKQRQNRLMRYFNVFRTLDSKVKYCPVPHLCDTKGDIAHIEPTGLSSHLAPHYRYWGGSNSQSIWSHGRQEGSGWDLACS